MSRELELKAAYLDAQGAKLELQLCPLLCPPTAWASKGWSGGKQARAEGMLRFSEEKIHKPLCQLERLLPLCQGGGSKKEAARRSKEFLTQYKNLQGWLGLKRVVYPESLAEEWLRFGDALEALMCTQPHMCSPDELTLT